MKAILSLPMLLFGFCAFTAGDEKLIGNFKFDMTYPEMKWGIKYKSHTVVEDFPYEKSKVKALKILLEFTKDVDDVTEMRRALGPHPLRSPKEPDRPIPLWFYFFDDDSVTIGKLYSSHLQGELTGKKGDAFRVWLYPLPEPFKKIHKVAARPGEKEKEK